MGVRESVTVGTALRGRALLAEPRLNKGTAFTAAERDELQLSGLLPPAVETIEQQLDRTLREFNRLHDDLERHVYLRQLQDHNEVLFVRFIRENLNEAMPIVYTPTVGLATQWFSRIYRRSQGLFLSYPDLGQLRQHLDRVDDDIAVVVATDAERILGLGDQGIGGIAIPNGKLALYSALGGIDPALTLPVVLDVGTNNTELLNDPCYLGWRHERITGPAYDSFVEEFVSALKSRFPNVLLQWEDFASHNATRLMLAYRDRIASFNDDIEGTAAVALAAIWAALKGDQRSLRQEQICIVGAGSAGTGIARILAEALKRESVANPRHQITLVDRDGVLHDRRQNLEAHQIDLARPVSSLPPGLTSALPLEELVGGIGATVLVGVSGQANLFTQPVIKAMTEATGRRPVIMPLSNPTSKAEARPDNIIEWSQGRALVATGSPFTPVSYRGKRITISQANNAYIFPGLGLGAIASGAKKITSAMFMAAAEAVFAGAPKTTARDLDDGVLPPLTDVPRLSKRIAASVARTACDIGLAEPMTDKEIFERIEELSWAPDYPNIVGISGEATDVN